MPLHGTLWRATRAVVVAVLATVVYLLVVPQRQVEHRQLGSLVVARTVVPGVPGRASFAQWVDPSQSTFAVARQAAHRDPDHTGLFAREWYVTPDASPEVGIVLELLPDVVTARAAAAKGAGQLLVAPHLSGERAGAGETFSISGVPGGRGATFPLSNSFVPANGTVGYAYKAVFRFGRAVVSELVVTAGSARSTSLAVADARAGYRLLQRSEPSFSFVHSHYPGTTSIVFGGVALVLVAGAVVVPEGVIVLVRRRREHKMARAQARHRQQYLARGRRTVRRHGAPPWAKTKGR